MYIFARLDLEIVSFTRLLEASPPDAKRLTHEDP
jgi:hypothetical protein